MGIEIKQQNKVIQGYYVFFLIISVLIIGYYFSNTLLHFTTPRQFPINSFSRQPLTILIFPAEIFSFLLSLYFLYSLFNNKNKRANPKKLEKYGDVAILLPIFNEPKEIVERTVKACTKLRYKGKVNVYILDDSNNDQDKRNMDRISEKYGTYIIRRKNNIGYKAGNINNAVKSLKEPYFVIFDSDQAPLPDFLEEMIDQFSDHKVAFVQAPQYFVNRSNTIERAMSTGSNIFYWAQSVSKSNDGAMVFCGTNAIIRTDVFKKINGFSYYTSTEDIEVGIRINSLGYIGVYVPKILVEGYAPTDFKAYSSQQYRWSNGNLAIFRESFFKIWFGDFSLYYKFHMISTLAWWLIGIVTLVYVLVPVISLLTHFGTHHTYLPTSMIFFLYIYVIVGIGMIYVSLKGRVDNQKVSIKDALLEYSLITNSMFIYARAAINSLLFKRYIGFVRTNKIKSDSGLKLIQYNLIFAVLFFVLSIYCAFMAARSNDLQYLRYYFPLSLWLLFYSLIFFSSILFIGDSGKEIEK